MNRKQRRLQLARKIYDAVLKESHEREVAAQSQLSASGILSTRLEFIFVPEKSGPGYWLALATVETADYSIFRCSATDVHKDVAIAKAKEDALCRAREVYSKVGIAQPARDGSVTVAGSISLEDGSGCLEGVDRAVSNASGGGSGSLKRTAFALDSDEMSRKKLDKYDRLAAYIAEHRDEYFVQRS